MAKSKQSEEEIIVLGKKLIQELGLETSVNTLGRWMAHYLAELIDKAEHCSSEEEKKIAQQECCDIILKLWREREYSPNNSKPLSELKPLIELLEVFKKDRFSVFSLPSWMKNVETEETWSSFLKLVKNNSSDIIQLCLYTSISKETLTKEQSWIQEHENMLSREELRLINSLEYIVNGGESVLKIFNKEDVQEPFLDLSPIERFNVIFDTIESKLEEQKIAMMSLKETITKGLTV